MASLPLVLNSSADTIDGGDDTDTITLSANSVTIVDADFTAITNVEKLTTANGTNSITLGTLADGSGLATVTGGTGVDTINASAFAGALTITSGAGADVITTQAGVYNLSVDSGANNDSLTVTASTLTEDDTIDAGAGTDTITLSANSATIVDADFTNIDNIEKLTTADGTNSLTLGTKAADSGFTTVTGGTGADTINASDFDGALTINTGNGADVITSQSGAYNLSIIAGTGADSVTVSVANFTSSDTVLGGTGTDTLIFDAATTKVDSHFSEINTFEKLTLGNGTNNITLGTVAANAGFATVTGRLVLTQLTLPILMVP